MTNAVFEGYVEQKLFCYISSEHYENYLKKFLPENNWIQNQLFWYLPTQNTKGQFPCKVIKCKKLYTFLIHLIYHDSILELKIGNVL